VERGESLIPGCERLGIGCQGSISCPGSPGLRGLAPEVPDYERQIMGGLLEVGTRRPERRSSLSESR
jgi:hypothetical protein